MESSLNSSTIDATTASTLPPSYADNADEFVEEICETEVYKEISTNDQDRWHNQPDQIRSLENNDRALYFDMKPYYKNRVHPYEDSSEDGWYYTETPLYKHNFECDKVIITLRYYPEGTVYTTNEQSRIIKIKDYFQNTNSIIVYRNGRKLSKDEFFEISENEIQLLEILGPKDSISVQYKTATLIEDIHYHSINSNIIRFKDNKIFTKFTITEMDVWGMRPNKEALNPIKFIDKKSKVITKTIQHWHPIHGYHFIEPYKNIDIASVDTTPKDFTNLFVRKDTVGNKEQLFTNMAGEDEFTITDFNYKLGNLNVYLNGVKLHLTDYIQKSETSFLLIEPLISDDDVLEACTWYPVEEKKQIFTDIPEHANVIDGKKFTTEFECEMGDLSVFLNGVKLFAYEYTQTSSNTFELTEPVTENTFGVIGSALVNALESTEENVPDEEVPDEEVPDEEVPDEEVPEENVPDDIESTEEIIGDGVILEASALVPPKSLNCSTFSIKRRVQYYTAVRDETDFTVDNFTSNTGEMSVYLNGFKLTSEDFTQTSETSFHLNEPIYSSRDVVEVNSWDIFGIASICAYAVQDREIKIDSIKNYGTSEYGFKDFHLNFDHRNLNNNLEDPAVYSNTLIQDQSNKGFTPWSKERVGTIWLDTGHFHYKRYHDTKCFPDCKDRLKIWGELADFAECRIYEWVESDISPEQWDLNVLESETNPYFEESKKVSGRLWYPYFEKVDEDAEEEDIEWKILDKTYEMFDAVTDGNPFHVNDQIDKCDATQGAAVTNGIGFITNFTNDEDGRSVINVYVNGILRLADITIPENHIVNVPNMNPCDRIYIVRSITEDKEILDGLIEDKTLMREYQYTKNTNYDSIGAKKDIYYFWVRDKTTKPDVKEKTMSALTIEDEIVNINNPYFILNGILPPRSFHYEDDYLELPWRMQRVIFKSLKGLIDADRRYTIRFTRDFTLRDRLDHGIDPMELKNKHEEWKLFREGQNYIISKDMWNRVTESIIGRKITNKNVPIPSYEREIYDINYGTETRFGLREGESFTNGGLAKISIIDYLKDSNNNFYPFKIDDFFAQHSFDSEEEIIESMDIIYSLVPYNHVNSMFFSVLYDALSMKHEYPDIIKTSWVSLHSIILLNDQGRFDD